MKSVSLIVAMLVLLAPVAFAKRLAPVETLMEQLNSKDRVVVAKAVYYLGEYGEVARPALPRLIELLGSKDRVYHWAWGPKDDFTDKGGRGYNTHYVAELAADTLAKLPSDPIPLMNQIKQTDSIDFKIHGIKLLGNWVKHDVNQEKPVSRDLMSFLLLTLDKSILQESELVEAVAGAIGKSKDKASVEQVIDLYHKQRSINSTVWEYRRHWLLRALGELGYQDATSLLVEELSRLELYTKVYRYTWVDLAGELISALDKIQDPSSKEAVSEFLKYFNSYVKLDSRSEKWPESERTSVENQTYRDRWLNTHKIAITLAGKLKATNAVSSLIDALDRKEVRKTSAYALVKIGDIRALPALLKVIEMTRTDVDSQKLETLKRETELSKLEPLLCYVRDYEPERVDQMPIDVAIEVKKKYEERNRVVAPGKNPPDWDE